MKRRILSVFLVFSFLVEMRAGIFATYFSIYVRNEIGASYTQIGIMLTLMYLVNALSQIVWGWMSDRIGKRKHFLAISEGIPGIVFLFIPMITNFVSLVIVMTVIQIAWSMAAPIWKALIAEHSAPEKRGESMGTITTLGGIGSILGIYIIGDLITGHGYAYLFYFSSFCMLSASVAAVFATEPEELKPSTQKLLSIEQVRTLVTEHRPFTMYTILILFFSFTLALIEHFLPLYAQALGASIQQFKYVFMVRNGMQTALMLPLGKLTDRIGRVKMLQISLTASAAAILLFGLSPSWQGLFLGVVVGSFGWSGYHVSSFAVLSSLTPRSARGTYMGFHSVVLALSKVAPSVAGPVADRSGFKMLFFSSFGLCTIIVFFFVAWLQKNRERIYQSEN